VVVGALRRVLEEKFHVFSPTSFPASVDVIDS
jgi:hypothetical protein